MVKSDKKLSLNAFSGMLVNAQSGIVRHSQTKMTDIVSPAEDRCFWKIGIGQSPRKSPVNS